MIIPAIRILCRQVMLPSISLHLQREQISRPTVLFEVALSKLAQPQRIALNYAQKQRGCRGYVRYAYTRHVCATLVHRNHGEAAFIGVALFTNPVPTVTRPKACKKKEIIRLHFLHLS